jgi:hypothetical protein
METASRPRLLFFALCAVVIVILSSYSFNKGVELNTQTPSGYHVMVSGNGTRLMHGRRNVTKYSMRFAKERKAKNSLTFVKNSIYSRWAVRQFPLFLSSMYLPIESWLTLKNKFVDLLIENEFTNNTKFVIGFVGDAATFDANRSYPDVVESTLSPIFQTLGMKLEVLKCMSSTYLYAMI